MDLFSNQSKRARFSKRVKPGIKRALLNQTVFILMICIRKKSM